MHIIGVWLDPIFEYIGRKSRSVELARKRKRLIKKRLLEIGAHTYGYQQINFYSYEGSETKIKIGRFCSISPGVTIISGGNHPLNWVSTYPFRAQWNLKGKYEDGMPFSKGDITVGHDVWIGTGVTILSGVSIGHGSVIAAGSLVTKSIQPYSIVGGNPCKLIRMRFSENQIKGLLKLSWWDWSDEMIMKHISLLSSPNVEKLLTLFDNKIKSG